MNRDAVEGYRCARRAQDERFDNRPGGGAVDHSMTDTEEYRTYFGIGEWAGGGVEKRLTFRDYLAGMGSAERDRPDAPGTWITMESAFYLTGADLATLAAAGDEHAAAEIVRRQIRRVSKRQKVA